MKDLKNIKAKNDELRRIPLSDSSDDDKLSDIDRKLDRIMKDLKNIKAVNDELSRIPLSGSSDDDMSDDEERNKQEKKQIKEENRNITDDDMYDETFLTNFNSDTLHKFLKQHAGKRNSCPINKSKNQNTKYKRQTKHKRQTKPKRQSKKIRRICKNN